MRVKFGAEECGQVHVVQAGFGGTHCLRKPIRAKAEFAFVNGADGPDEWMASVEFTEIFVVPNPQNGIIFV